MLGSSLRWSPGSFWRQVRTAPARRTCSRRCTLGHRGSRRGRVRTRRSCASANSRDGSRSAAHVARSEEHTSELQSQFHLVCRLLLEKKKNLKKRNITHNKNEHSFSFLLT